MRTRTVHLLAMTLVAVATVHPNKTGITERDSMLRTSKWNENVPMQTLGTV
jgi:hypothetical protein